MLISVARRRAPSSNRGRAWAYRGDRAHSSEDREATDPARAPRRRGARRVRVVAGEGRSGGDRAPPRGERLHEGAHRAPRDPAGAHLRGDQGPHQGDRPQRADAARATGGTTPARSRASSTASTAARPSPRPDDWEPPVLPEASADEVTDAASAAIPGEQVLLDDNLEAEGHEFYSLGSFDVTADGSTMLYATDVEGDERYTIRLRAIDGTRPRIRRRHRGHRSGCGVRPDRALPLLCDRRRVVAPRHDLAPRGRHADLRRRLGVPRARRAVLARRRPHAQPPVPHDRGGLERHERDLAARRRRPVGRVHRGLAAQGRRRVRRGARRGGRQGPPARRAQRRRGELRARERRGIRPAGTAHGCCCRTTPPCDSRASTRSATSSPSSTGARACPGSRSRRCRPPASPRMRRPTTPCTSSRSTRRCSRWASAATPPGSSRCCASGTRASSRRRPCTTW